MLRLTVLCLVLGAFAISAFAQRPSSGAVKTGTPPPPKVNIVSESDPLADFPEKGLPEPASIGGAPSPVLAAELARRISKYDDDALPTLITALQLCGFYIMDQNQKLLYMPRGGDGVDIAFYDFEVAGMLRSSSIGMGMTLDKLGSMIATDLPANEKAAFPQMMLRDVRNALNSDNRHIKFAAAFVMELSRSMPQPVDLKTASTASTLNIIQISILERLFILELLTKYDALGSGVALFDRNRLFPRQITFRNVSFEPAPVDLCSNIATINDFVKYGKTGQKVYKSVKLYKEIASGIKTIEDARKFPSGVSIANAVLAWMKLVAAMMSVKADIKVQEPLPLVRTRSTRNPGGDEREVTANFKIEFANSATLNCIGKSLGSVTNVNLSVPESGPLKDRPVSWELIEQTQGPEKFVSEPVYIKGDGSGPSIDRQKANANGDSKITLIGKPQRVDLTQQPAVPTPKEVVLLVSIALEKMDASKDLPKIGKFGLSVLADPFAAVEMIPEVLSKMKLKTYKVRVPIRDFQPCSEDWGGLISVRHEFMKTEVISSSKLVNGNTTGSGIRTRQFVNEAHVTLRPRLPEEMDTKPPNKAAVSLNGFFKDITEITRPSDPCCGPTEGNYTTRVRRGSEMRYARTDELPVSVILRSSERDYSLGFEIPTFNFPVTYHNFSIVESNCPLEEGENDERTLDSQMSLTFHLMPGRYPDRFVNSEADILKGTKTVSNPGTDDTFTWSWELARCGK